MGRGTHLQYDRDPARLVHLAPAHLGRAHRASFCARSAIDRSIEPELTSIVELFAEAWRGRLVRRRSGRVASRRTKCAACGGTSSAARRTSSTSGSNPGRVGLRCWKPSPNCAFPATSTPRAAISIAAGSTPHCCLRWRAAQCRAVSRGRHLGLDAR